MPTDAEEYLLHLQRKSLESLSSWATGVGVLKHGGYHGISEELIKDSHEKIRKEYEAIVSRLDEEDKNKLSGVPIGVLYLPNFNAYTICTEQGSKIIALNIKLDPILVQFNSVILLWMKGGLRYSIDEYIQKHSRDLVNPLRDIMQISYELRDEKQISKIFNNPTDDFLAMKKMVACQLTFVLAHEMGHIIHDHSENSRQIISVSEGSAEDYFEIEAFLRKHQDEYEADVTGFEICKKHFPDSSFIFNYVSIFFLVSYLYERINHVNRLIQQNLNREPLKIFRENTIPTARGTHPPAPERIKNIYFKCFKELHSASNNAQVISRLFRHSLAFFDRYFSMQLITWHQEGKIILMGTEGDYRTEIDIF